MGVYIGCVFRTREFSIYEEHIRGKKVVNVGSVGGLNLCSLIWRCLRNFSFSYSLVSDHSSGGLTFQLILRSCVEEIQ